MLPEKSSYQITRYLNSSVEVTLREICKFLIKFHWNIKEDFRILKTYGKNSTEYLERKALIIPNFGERVTFLEAFLLLYYFYKKKHQLNLTYIYNHILDVNFWNVLSTAPLNELLEFCENYSSLKPYTINTEIKSSLIAEKMVAGGEYKGETDVSKFIDRESSTLSLNSFRPIVLADEDKFYMVHRFQNLYRYSRLVIVTQHNIHFNNQKLISLFYLPINYILYDAYIIFRNGKKFIRFIVKHIGLNSYKYADLDLENHTLTPIALYEYSIFSHQTVEDSFQLWNKYRAVIVSNNCNTLELKILQDETIFRNTIIPQAVYNFNADPYTLQVFLSDEFVFILNWTKLSYGIYKFYQDVWEVGFLENLTRVKDLRVYLIPDTKNRVKILVNRECGLRVALKNLNEEHFVGEEGLVLHSVATEETTTGEILSEYIGEGIAYFENLFFSADLNNIIGGGLVYLKEPLFFMEDNIMGEGLVYVKKIEGFDFSEECQNLQETNFQDFLLEIKEKLDLYCKNFGRSLSVGSFYWLNTFNSDKTAVYEIEVFRNSNHIKRTIERKQYYIDFVMNIFNKNLAIVPVMMRSVSFTTSYGSNILVYDSFNSFRILRLHSFQNKEDLFYSPHPPYDCNELRLTDMVNNVNRTIRQLVCAYSKEFKYCFVYNNSGLERETTTITRFNPEVIDGNISIFDSLTNINELRDVTIRYLLPTIYTQLSHISVDDAIPAIVLTVSQYLGLSSGIIYSYSPNSIDLLLDLLLMCFFPIHSHIVGGKLKLIFDSVTPNTITLDDSLLIVQNLNLYDYIIIGEDIL